MSEGDVKLTSMADDQLVTQPTLIAALTTAVAALAGVVIYLWRHGLKLQRKIDREHAAMTEERKAWAVERETLRANYEAENAKVLQQVHKECFEESTVIRKEFTELMDKISVRAEKSADAISAVLQKFLDRFLGPRNR